MKLTEVTMTLASPADVERHGIRAYVSVTFDDSFAVREIKLTDRAGAGLLNMPSRKVTSDCAACHRRAELVYEHCPHCGAAKEKVSDRTAFANIAFPINPGFRQYLTREIVQRYNSQVSEELKLRDE